MNRRWTDADLLDVMHLVEDCKWTYSQVAARQGTTRSAIASVVRRVNRAVNKSEAST